MHPARARTQDCLLAETVVPDFIGVLPRHCIQFENDVCVFVHDLQAVIIDQHAEFQAGAGADLDDVVSVSQSPHKVRARASLCRSGLQNLHVECALERLSADVDVITLKEILAQLHECEGALHDGLFLSSHDGSSRKRLAPCCITAWPNAPSKSWCERAGNTSRPLGPAARPRQTLP